MATKRGQWKTDLNAVALAIFAGLFAGQALGQSVRVEREMLIEEVRLDGRIEAVQQSTVSAQTSGTIVSLPVDVDDVVGALDDLGIVLDDDDGMSFGYQGIKSFE